MKKLFGELNITWKKLIIFSIFIGIYTGIVAMLHFLRDTSFQDISITFECWILFGTLIIMNSKSPKDSALKCFIFFLISQPLVYLVQVPFNEEGFSLFRFYPGWFKWTLLTIPMGYIGYYLKKDKWWGLFIITPVLLFIGFHYMGFLKETITFFPNHLLSSLLCLFMLIVFPLYIFKNKKLKTIGLVISILIILSTSIYTIAFSKKSYYETEILSSGGDIGVTFDDTYKVSLKDNSYGDVSIIYFESVESYMVHAVFKKTGKTELILESPDGKIIIFDLDIQRYSYDISIKN